MHLPNLYASIHSFISAEYKPFYGSKYVVFVSANKFSWSEANTITKVHGLLFKLQRWSKHKDSTTDKHSKIFPTCATWNYLIYS